MGGSSQCYALFMPDKTTSGAIENEWLSVLLGIKLDGYTGLLCI